MTTASHYFLPGDDGSPPMFGPQGYARDFTPKVHGGAWRLGYMPPGVGQRHAGIFPWITDRGDYKEPERPESALALCIVAAMGWIRSKGWHVEIDTEGLLILFTQDEDGEVYREKVIHPISGQPDWLGAAKWVYGQSKQAE